MNIQENFPLKKYNTFGVKSSARYFVEIGSDDALKTILADPYFTKKNKLLLGGGSNILFTKDFDGLVIKLSSNTIKIIEENDNEVVIEAAAGGLWHDLIHFCAERNYGGIENLALIPGTVGAAPIQNIGAYGQEIKDAFHSLKGIALDTLEERFFFKNDCNFGYRNSIFKSVYKNRLIITKVTLTLSKRPVINISYRGISEELEKLGKDNPSVKEMSQIISAIRRAKLPDPAELGNAGSFFKNPVISGEYFKILKEKYPDIIGYKVNDSEMKISAGWLIEQAGLKGKRIGSTGTHRNHALVIVNYGEATGEEIVQFQAHIKDVVFNKFGIVLEEEVNII